MNILGGCSIFVVGLALGILIVVFVNTHSQLGSVSIEIVPDNRVSRVEMVTAKRISGPPDIQNGLSIESDLETQANASDDDIIADIADVAIKPTPTLTIKRVIHEKKIITEVEEINKSREREKQNEPPEKISTPGDKDLLWAAIEEDSPFLPHVLEAIQSATSIGFSRYYPHNARYHSSHSSSITSTGKSGKSGSNVSGSSSVIKESVKRKNSDTALNNAKATLRYLRIRGTEGEEEEEGELEIGDRGGERGRDIGRERGIGIVIGRERGKGRVLQSKRGQSSKGRRSGGSGGSGESFATSHISIHTYIRKTNISIHTYTS